MKKLSDIFRGGLSKSFLFKLISILLMLGGIAYLTEQLYHSNDLNSIGKSWAHFSGKEFILLLVVIVLMPVNLTIEAIKWKRTIRNLEKISLIHSVAAVLSGMSTGFITPNKVGDIWGRLFWIKNENREKGVGYLAINSMTQNLAITLAGLPSAILFFLSAGKSESQNNLIYWFAVITLAMILLYYKLPGWLGNSKNRWLIQYTEGMKSLSSRDLNSILGWALVRYLIFIVQFYLLLHCLGTKLTLMQAAMTIPAYFLFITFTPSIALSDAVIRSSYAVFFLGAVSNQPLVLSLAGVTLWIINVVMPVIVGNLLIIRKNIQKK